MLKGNFGENPIELWDKDKTYADIDFLFFLIGKEKSYKK